MVNPKIGLKTRNVKITFRPVIAVNKTCTLTSRYHVSRATNVLSRSRLEKSLVSVSSRRVNVSGGERLCLVSISWFYVSCPSLLAKVTTSFVHYTCVHAYVFAHTVSSEVIQSSRHNCAAGLEKPRCFRKSF